MSLIKKHLFIKRSGIPTAGKGLFTKVQIEKGADIIEYTGKITTWKKVLEGRGFNGYVFYVNRNHVIDAKHNLKSLGRYVNDANGLIKKKGIINNAKYVEMDGRVFIRAIRNIPPGSEVFVSYRKEYWDVIRHNIELRRKPANDLSSKK